MSSPVRFDATRCTRDGICTAVCPSGLIRLEEGAPAPRAVPEIASGCIRCGHCVAACPTGAVALASMRPEDCPPLRPKLALDVDHVEHFLRSRRSVRHFEQRAVDRATLSRLIAIARYAPTGHNAQSVRWTVVDSPAGVKEMARITMDFMRSVSDEERALPLPAKELVNAWDSGIDIVGRDAPALVVAYVATEDPVAFADPVLALSYLELAAPSFGLGACWNGFFMATISQWPPLRHALGLPEGRMSLGAVLLGYPEYGYQRLPSRRPPRITWAE